MRKKSMAYNFKINFQLLSCLTYKTTTKFVCARSIFFTSFNRNSSESSHLVGGPHAQIYPYYLFFLLIYLF